MTDFEILMLRGLVWLARIIIACNTTSERNNHVEANTLLAQMEKEMRGEA